MRLAETQSRLTAGLMPHGSTLQRSSARQLICTNERIPPELALQIYGNNGSGALTRALSAAYPACVRILSEACFNSLAQRFIEHTPSEQPDLNRYGATFGDFLDDWTATREQFSDYRYLGDLARLEWLCHTAYYAGDDPPFDFDTVAAASHAAPETLHFRLGQGVGLLQSEYPVMEIRETNLSAGDAAAVRAGDLPEYLVVSRPACQPRVERVAAAAFRLLAACRDGKTLGHIVSDSRPAVTVADSLPGLVRRGWIAGVTVDTRGPPGDP